MEKEKPEYFKQSKIMIFINTKVNKVNYGTCKGLLYSFFNEILLALEDILKSSFLKHIS